MTPRIGSLFAGYGGLEMGVSSVLGGHPAWFSEFDDHPSRILAHHHPDVPNHGDITRIDWSTVEPIDVLTGGFPCQDVSHAGARAGLKNGTRTGLWSYMRDAIHQLRPRLVVAENVRGLLSADADSSVEPCPWCMGDPDTSRPMRALGAVLADLADLGYDAWWCGLRAADVGAPHGRFRVFIFAWPADAAGDARWLRDGDRTAPADPRGEVGVVGAGLRQGGPAGNGRGLTARGGRSADAGTLMPTPRASDGAKGGPNQHGSSGDLMLPSAVALLPTPRALDATGVRGVTENRSGTANARAGLTLTDFVYADRFGDYGAAVARWATLTRPAPDPTEPTGKGGAHRLSPAFVEWMMGLPEGHITDPAIWDGLKPSTARNAQLKALGNGVVPPQAAEATQRFLAFARTQEAAA